MYSQKLGFTKTSYNLPCAEAINSRNAQVVTLVISYTSTMVAATVLQHSLYHCVLVTAKMEAIISKQLDELVVNLHPHMEVPLVVWYMVHNNMIVQHVSPCMNVYSPFNSWFGRGGIVKESRNKIHMHILTKMFVCTC